MFPTPTRTPDDLPTSAESATPAAGVTALIPLRTGGKSRLEAELDRDGRADLVLAMLDDVVAALHAAGIADVRVLCGDGTAAAAASARGLDVVLDPVDASVRADADARTHTDADAAEDAAENGAARAGGGDVLLRRAVDAGLAAIGSTRIRLVVAADLPQLTGDEVAAILASASDVTVTPTRGGGTAVLRLAAGVTLPTQYGPSSARAHLDIARRDGLSVAELDLPGARQDVDGAADLHAIDGGRCSDGVAPLGAATTTFLAGRHG